MGLLVTSDGQQIGNEREFDASGGFGEPLPDNTEVLACIEKIEWDNFEGEDFINIQWEVLQPAEYKGRKLFQGLKVFNQETKKSDKARRMLGALDAMHGGKISKLPNGGEHVINGDTVPSDAQLAGALVNKLTVLKIGYYDMTDRGGKTGNWVKAVAERKPNNGSAGAAGVAPEPPTTKPAEKPAKQKFAAANGKAVAPPSEMFDDDIPF